MDSIEAKKEPMMATTEHGFSMIEILFAIALFALMGLGLAHSMITSLHARGHNVVSSTAAQIALETLEDMAAIDPSTLSDTDDQTDVPIVRNGYTFLLTVDLTIEVDRSRTVDVSVRNEAFGILRELSNSFALWNKR